MTSHRPAGAGPLIRASSLALAPALALTLALAPTGIDALPAARTATAQSGDVDALLADLTPRQRVGQLCLMPFDGQTIEAGSLLAELLDAGAIGGVILDPGHGNFRNGPDTPRQVAGLVDALQARAATARGDAPFIPLLVAVDGRGGASALGPLTGGMTPQPREMALGATWRPAHATTMGEIAGRELAVVGVNLLLGPSLDVANVPRPSSSGDLGTRTFGGHSAWVARFGAAFVEGVHRGAAGRVAVAAGNFPGTGGADRSQTDELPIVESTLEELLGQELAPFLRVTDPEAARAAQADAVLATHVRYRGIQRQIERPLALDGSGLRYLWAQIPPLDEWRRAGGVVVSPGLGLPAVRRYVDPEMSDFSVRRVLREALLADNDILMLTGLGAPGDAPSEAAAIREGLDWLVAAYAEDESVRDAVDASLRRVLALKMRLAPTGDPAEVRPAVDLAADRTGLGLDAASAVARDALTQLAPAGGGRAAGAQPVASPQRGDRLLFVVDGRRRRECPACPETLDPDPARFVAAALRTYGPAGSGTARIERPEDVAAIGFDDLRAWLAASGKLAPEDNPAEVPALDAARLRDVDAAIAAADWMVFAMRDIDPVAAPASDAMRLFLRTRRPDATVPQLVAIALEAPYYLDATEIAKLSAYYAAYSPLDPFVDVAVRAVFGDQPAPGASPVSVAGAGYDLPRQLAPDPTQSIDLELVGRDAGRPLALGQVATLRTRPVYDANGNLVPDGTDVAFRTYVRAEDVYLRDLPARTVDGIATSILTADRAGELEVSAVFGNGLATAPLVVTVAGEPPLAGAADAALAALPRALPAAPIDGSILLLSLTLVLLGAVVVYGLESESALGPSRMLRRALLSVAWGLGGYLLVVVGGLRFGGAEGGGPWPAGWSEAYQAPIASFVLALMPAVWPLLKGLGRR